MNASCPIAAAIRSESSAAAHEDAHPRSKAAAMSNDVSFRTERRWRHPRSSKGSPLYRFAEYLETAQDPWRLLAHNYSTVMERELEQLTRQEVIDTIRKLHVESAIHDGQEKANRSRHGMRHLDRSKDAERAATFQLKLALWRIAEKKGITESEILGASS